MAVDRKIVVVFFNARHLVPLRATNEAHLNCWGSYSRHRVLYVNVAFGVPWALLDRLPIGAVIFDTIFLSMHWAPEYFRDRAALCAPVAALKCPKIAVVQDEFYNIDLVVNFLREVGATHILTCSEPDDWEQLYGRLDLSRVVLRTSLTGYVDEQRLAQIRPIPLIDRPVDLGYRAWDNPYWLGEHGLQKVKIGQVLGEAARRRGLHVDINNPIGTEFLTGGRWFDFLLQCRAVVGVEGGASVLDRRGEIKERVERYVATYPGATFEETRAACFPEVDGKLGLACLSPRHFEAAMTRTCQILLEGHYNGVFLPWEHYIPVKSDYSNVAQALDALQDDELVENMVERAYADIIASGRWSYRSFVRDVEQTIIEPAPSLAARGVYVWALAQVVRVRADILWWYAHWEHSKCANRLRVIVHRWRAGRARAKALPSRVLRAIRNRTSWLKI